MESVAKEKKEEAKQRKLHDEAHEAGEPVWKLKLNAHQARKALRDGRCLTKQLERGIIKLDSIPRDERELIEDFHARRLHARVDRANKKYGHGIARTHDFGFAPGENMCRDVPIEVRAQLRTLQSS